MAKVVHVIESDLEQEARLVRDVKKKLNVLQDEYSTTHQQLQWAEESRAGIKADLESVVRDELSRAGLTETLRRLGRISNQIKSGLVRVGGIDSAESS